MWVEVLKAYVGKPPQILFEGIYNKHPDRPNLVDKMWKPRKIQVEGYNMSYSKPGHEEKPQGKVTLWQAKLELVELDAANQAKAGGPSALLISSPHYGHKYYFSGAKEAVELLKSTLEKHIASLPLPQKTKKYASKRASAASISGASAQVEAAAAVSEVQAQPQPVQPQAQPAAGQPAAQPTGDQAAASQPAAGQPAEGAAQPASSQPAAIPATDNSQADANSGGQLAAAPAQSAPAGDTHSQPATGQPASQPYDAPAQQGVPPQGTTARSSNAQPASDAQAQPSPSPAPAPSSPSPSVSSPGPRTKHYHSARTNRDVIVMTSGSVDHSSKHGFVSSSIFSFPKNITQAGPIELSWDIPDHDWHNPQGPQGIMPAGNLIYLMQANINDPDMMEMSRGVLPTGGQQRGSVPFNLMVFDGEWVFAYYYTNPSGLPTRAYESAVFRVGAPETASNQAVEKPASGNLIKVLNVQPHTSVQFEYAFSDEEWAKLAGPTRFTDFVGVFRPTDADAHHSTAWPCNDKQKAIGSIPLQIAGPLQIRYIHNGANGVPARIPGMVVEFDGDKLSGEHVQTANISLSGNKTRGDLLSADDKTPACGVPIPVRWNFSDAEWETYKGPMPEYNLIALALVTDDDNPASIKGTLPTSGAKQGQGFIVAPLQPGTYDLRYRNMASQTAQFRSPPIEIGGASAPPPGDDPSAAAPARGAALAPDQVDPADEQAGQGDKSCSVCMERKSIAAFVPCGHIATCLTCASRLHECCICRQPIASFMKTFQQ